MWISTRNTHAEYHTFPAHSIQVTFMIQINSVFTFSQILDIIPGNSNAQWLIDIYACGFNILTSADLDIHYRILAHIIVIVYDKTLE